MTAVLRRLAVPIVGAGLIVVIVAVGLFALDLDGQAGYGASSVPPIEIGSTPATSGQGAGMPQGQNGAGGTGSMLHGSGMTVVTDEVHIYQGHMHQGESDRSDQGGDASCDPTCTTLEE